MFCYITPMFLVYGIGMNMKSASNRVQPHPPKHLLAREALRRRIETGIYPPGSRLPTEVELPKILETGKQTVVRALNDLVREGLIYRRRGDGTYVADRSAQPLIPGRRLRVGVLWFRSVLPERLQTHFQGAITRGLLAAWGLNSLEPAWSRAGEREPTCAVWTSVTRGLTLECLGESLYSRARHPDLEAVRAGRFDALLTLGILEEEWLEALLGLGLPTVLVDFLHERFAERADQVFVDPLPGYRAAVRHFFAQGLRRIHFVGSLMSLAAPSAEMTPAEVSTYRDGRRRVDPDSYLRLSAYRVALDECRLAASDAAVHFEWAGIEGGRRLAERLLALPECERPEAVVCHSASQAEELMAACAELGLLLKGAGGAEEEYRGAALPIRADGVQLGRAAAELLLGKLQRPERLPLRVGVPMLLHAEATRPVPAGVPL